MKRATADEALRKAARGGDNELFYSMRALLGLGKSFPPDLVRIALQRLHDAKIPLLPSCRKLPDAAVPLLLEVLDGPERVFLDSFAQGPVDGAHDASLDALLPLVHAATRGQHEGLDVLETQLQPFARGAVEQEVLPLLARAVATRATDTPLQSFARGLGLPTGDFQFSATVESRERSVGLLRRARLWLQLDSKRLPHVRVFVAESKGMNPTSWRCDDFVCQGRLPLPDLESLAAFPLWKAAVARKLKVQWDLPGLVKSSLRGHARERLVAWLAG